MTRSYFWYASIFIVFTLATGMIRFYFPKRISTNHLKDNFSKELSGNKAIGQAKLKTRCDVNLRKNSDRLSVYLDERRKRIQLIEEMCLKYSDTLSDGANKDVPMVIDRKHHVLFKNVAKVASTSLLRIFSHIVLAQYQDLPHEKVPKIDDVHHINLTCLADLPKIEQNKVLNTYYKFTFVRDPFQRLVSAFRNKFMNTKDPFFRRRFGPSITMWDNTFTQKVNANTSAMVDGVTYTFRSFLRYLAVTDTKEYNNHWARLTDLILPCKIKYDFIGKIETLEEDFNYISKCKLHEGKLISFYPSKKSETNFLYEEYYKSVDPFDLLKVYEIFRMDFKVFGYPTPSIVTQVLQRLSDTNDA